jgi:colicin import membrane protein
MPKVTTSRPKRTKPEIEKEYSKIAEEVSARQESANPKDEELAKLRETETRQAVEGISIESVVQRVSALGLDISKSLSDQSAKLVAEVERLTTVREAVALETKEIERLHKIDLAATALDQLIQEYKSRREKLEAEINSQRAAWEAEQLDRSLAQKEYEDNLKKQRQREAEDYEYRKNLERKKAQDKYDEEIRLLEKKNQEKQETLEKSWKLREAALKEKEEEWARLKKEVDDFPARLNKEIDAAAKAAAKATEQKFEQQILLMKKDAESDKRLAELQIKALQETLTRQSAEIGNLQKQLEEAKRQVQDIAVKAIEGASGAKALAHVNQIAMEQAKTRLPQS